MNKLVGSVLSAVALTVMTASISAAASIGYVRSTVGAPWGESTNEQAMDLAFGAGNWDDLRFETASVGTLLTPATTFLFLEGGDSNADELEAFLGANQPALESWVSSGGSLFINSAPNEGDGMSFGFGGVQLNYPGFGNTVHAVNVAHPIFAGPIASVPTDYTGTAFSHAFLSGPALTSIIEDELNRSVLATMSYGAGFVMFGGMTTTNFHSPGTEALNLRANMLAFAAEQGGDLQAAPVPEPATLTLFGLGLAAAARRRRKQ